MTKHVWNSKRKWQRLVNKPAPWNPESVTSALRASVGILQQSQGRGLDNVLQKVAGETIFKLSNKCRGSGLDYRKQPSKWNYTNRALVIVAVYFDLIHTWLESFQEAPDAVLLWCLLHPYGLALGFFHFRLKINGTSTHPTRLKQPVVFSVNLNKSALIINKVSWWRWGFFSQVIILFISVVISRFQPRAPSLLRFKGNAKWYFSDASSLSVNTVILSFWHEEFLSFLNVVCLSL